MQSLVRVAGAHLVFAEAFPMALLLGFLMWGIIDEGRQFVGLCTADPEKWPMMADWICNLSAGRGGHMAMICVRLVRR
jgi:hypothetical protein